MKSTFRIIVSFLCTLLLLHSQTTQSFHIHLPSSKVKVSLSSEPNNNNYNNNYINNNILPPPPIAVPIFSSIGALDTLYLTLQKSVPQSSAIQSISKLCPPSLNDCASTVLSSPFSSLSLGPISIPLSFFGLVTSLFVIYQTSFSPYAKNQTLLKITFQTLTLIR